MNQCTIKRYHINHSALVESFRNTFSSITFFQTLSINLIEFSVN